MKRRPLDFRSIDEVIAELERLHRTGYTAGGNWNLAQTCNHLAIFVRGSLEGFQAPRPPWYIRLMGPLIVWWMIRSRKMPEGVNIPNELRPQPDHKEDAAELAKLEELLRRFKDHKGPLQPSPLAGKLKYDTWLNLHLVHCAHHLSFLLPREPVSTEPAASTGA